MKTTFEAISTDQESHKDKKIIDLAKKNRGLQLQVESLKTKTAKAVEIALKLKKDQENPSFEKTSLQQQKKIEDLGTSLNFSEDSKKLKELEKRVTKMRNENQ